MRVYQKPGPTMEVRFTATSPAGRKMGRDEIEKTRLRGGLVYPEDTPRAEAEERTVKALRKDGWTRITIEREANDE
jgi:hypothetical protein